MTSGRLSDYFEQFRGRIKYQLDIPAKIFRSEVEDVVKFFNPAPTQCLVELTYKTAGARDGKLRTLLNGAYLVGFIRKCVPTAAGISDLSQLSTLTPAELHKTIESLKIRLENEKQKMADVPF